ncbi:MAG: hypothetical protein AAFU54_22010 [Chloroflexota bacterium]
MQHEKEPAQSRFETDVASAMARIQARELLGSLDRIQSLTEQHHRIAGDEQLSTIAYTAKLERLTHELMSTAMLLNSQMKYAPELRALLEEVATNG